MFEVANQTSFNPSWSEPQEGTTLGYSMVVALLTCIIRQTTRNENHTKFYTKFCSGTAAKASSQRVLVMDV